MLSARSSQQILPGDAEEMWIKEDSAQDNERRKYSLSGVIFTRKNSRENIHSSRLRCLVLSIISQRLTAEFGVRSVRSTSFSDVWPVVAD